MMEINLERDKIDFKEKNINIERKDDKKKNNFYSNGSELFFHPVLKEKVKISNWESFLNFFQKEENYKEKREENVTTITKKVICDFKKNKVAKQAISRMCFLPLKTLEYDPQNPSVNLKLTKDIYLASLFFVPQAQHFNTESNSREKRSHKKRETEQFIFGVKSLAVSNLFPLETNQDIANYKIFCLDISVDSMNSFFPREDIFEPNMSLFFLNSKELAIFHFCVAAFLSNILGETEFRFCVGDLPHVFLTRTLYTTETRKEFEKDPYPISYKIELDNLIKTLTRAANNGIDVDCDKICEFFRRNSIRTGILFLNRDIVDNTKIENLLIPEDQLEITDFYEKFKTVTEDAIKKYNVNKDFTIILICMKYFFEFILLDIEKKKDGSLIFKRMITYICYNLNIILEGKENFVLEENKENYREYMKQYEKPVIKKDLDFLLKIFNSTFFSLFFFLFLLFLLSFFKTIVDCFMFLK